ncbi:MAG: hypothetical protein MUC86_12330 [Burkholderiaceae bacterium]|nr:hypothetical protein [Burkholderiaceae bacterium]
MSEPAASLDAIPFMRDLGAVLVRAEGGQAELRLDLADRHMNSWGVGHGGVVGRVLHRSITMAYCEAELFSGDGTLAAKAMGTFKFLHRLDAAPRIR